MGNIAAAELEIQDVLRSAPDDVTALFDLAGLYTDAGRAEEAGKLLRRVAAAHPEGKYLRFLGDSLFQLGKYEEAIDYYRQSLRANPGDRGAIVGLAHAEARVHHFAAAMETLKAYLAKHPDDDLVRADLAKFAGSAEAYEESERQWRMLAQRHPDDPSIQISLARQLYEAGRFDEAVAMARSLLDGNPNEPSALAILADDAFLTGNAPEAVKWLERLVAANPTSVRANQLGSLHLEMGQARLGAGDVPGARQELDKAIEVFRKSAEMDSTNADAVLGMVTALRLSGRTEQSLEVANDVLAKHPKLHAVRRALYESYLELGRYSEANKYLTLLREDFPNHVYLEHQYALVLFAEGDRDRAIAVLRRMLERQITPSVPVLLYHGISEFGRMPEPSASGATVTPVAGGEMGATLFLLANLYAWSGRFADALAIYDRLERQGFDKADVSMARGQVAAWQGDFAEARRLYEESFALRPVNDVRAAAKLDALNEHLRPYAGAEGYFYHDNRERTNFSVGPNGRAWLTDRLSVSTLYHHTDFVHDGVLISRLPRSGTAAEPGTATGSKRARLHAFGNEFEVQADWTKDWRNGIAFAAGAAQFDNRSSPRVLSSPDVVPLLSGSVNAGIGDWVDVSAGGSHGYVAAAGSILEKLTYTGGVGRIRAQPWNLFNASLQGGYNRYSDGNDRVALVGRLTRYLLRNPDLEAGYQFTFDDTQERDPFSYAPDRFTAHEALIAIQGNLLPQVLVGGERTAAVERALLAVRLGRPVGVGVLQEQRAPGRFDVPFLIVAVEGRDLELVGRPARSGFGRSDSMSGTGVTAEFPAKGGGAPTGMTSFDEIKQRIDERAATVGVIGLGYVGLPLACTVVESGLRAVGFDVDGAKIDSLLAGTSYIRHISSERVRGLLSPVRSVEKLATNGSGAGLLATADFSDLRFCDAIVICVPTPLTEGREPDLSYVRHTTETVARHLRRGQLVILESTTYPGTTDEVLLPILRQGGLEVGRDFFLAFSPEREDPANPSFTTRTIPKLVGGVTPECGRLAASLYRVFIENVVPVSSARVAESAKLLENIFRSVNIALVNELKMLFDRMDIDVWEVIDAAATKPFGYMPFHPGPGLGGHCIPIDPFYLTWKARHFDFSTRFIELAGEINTAMPYYVVERVVEALSGQGKAIRGACILVLGVAYKKDVDDLRESPSLKLIEILESRGAEVCYNDPYVHSLRARRFRHYDTFELDSQPLSDALLRRADCVLIATDHSSYDYERIVATSRLVVDSRNATRNVRGGREKIVKA